MRRDLDVIWAIALRDLQMLSRYPVNFANLILLPLYSLLIPSLLLGYTFRVGETSFGLQATSGTGDLVGFLFLGAFMSGLGFGIFWGTSWVLAADVQTGALESTWLSPARREIFVLGNAVASLLVATLSGLVLLAIGWVFFGARYDLPILQALPAVAISLVGLVGVAYLITAAILTLKEATFMVDTTSFLFMIGSGAMFPLTIFPLALQLVAFALPTTFALDVMRVHALGSRPLLPLEWEYVVLVVSAAVLLPFGRWVYRRTERRILGDGTLWSY
jgi:ABC-2 type transport system permease protein